MAARINVKLLLIVIIVLGTIFATLGAIYVVNSRTDVTRFIASGDELAAQGEHRRAIIHYRRAVGRDRLNLEWIDRLRSSIRQVDPSTENEAFDYFLEYVTTYQHVVTHYPLEAHRHLEYLELVYTAASEQLGAGFWELVRTGGSNMLDRLPESDPDREMGKFFVAAGSLAPARLAALQSDAIEEGYRMLEEFLESNPDDQRALGVFVDAKLAEADRRRLDNRIAALESLEAARDLLRRSVDGELAALWLSAALPRFQLLERQLEGERSTFTQDEVDAAHRRAFATIDANDQRVSIPLLLRVLLNVEERRLATTMPDPLELVEAMLVVQPASSRLEGIQAQLMLTRGRFSEASEAAQRIFDRDAGRVGLETLRYWQLRRFAASVLFDISVVEWEQATAEGAPAEVIAERLAEIGRALDRLRGVTTFADEDTQFMYAQARHHFANGDFARAASMFDRLVREQRMVSPQVLVYSAVTLERQGQLGLALQRVETALEDFPNNPVILRALLRIAEARQDNELVRATLDRLEAVEPGSEFSARVRRRLAERTQGPTGDELSLREVFEQVTELVRSEAFDDATRLLDREIAERPTDLRLYRALAEVRFAAGDRRGARLAVERALEREPDNRFFIALREVAEIEDPLEGVQRWWNVFEDDPRDRLFSEIREVNVRQIRAMESAQAAERAGDAARSREQRALADRFRARGDALMAEAIRSYPDDRETLGLRMDRAVRAQDWREAETVLVDVRRTDADLAGGFFFEGRMRLAREDFEGAIRALREATRRLTFSADVHFALGTALVAVGNVTEALRSFEQAYEINPFDERVMRALADGYTQLGNLSRAAEIARSLVQRSPADRELRERWLALELESGGTDVVLRERRAMHHAVPDDLRNLTALVHMLERRPPDRRSMLDDAGEPRYSPQRWQMMSPARQQEEFAAERTRRRQEVDRILRAARPSDAAPMAMIVWSMLSADVELGRGRGDQAEVMLTDLAGRMEGDGRLVAVLALADIQRRRGRVEDALRTYRTLEGMGFGDRPELPWHIASTLLNSGRAIEAIPHVERLAGGDLDARIRLWSVNTFNSNVQATEVSIRDVELALVDQLRRTDRLAEARERFDRVQAGAEQTILLRSIELELLIAEANSAWSLGDEARAREIEARIEQRSESFARAYPVSETPFLVRANRKMQEYRRTRVAARLDEAARLLSTADTLAPGNIGLLRARYVMLVEGGQRTQAEALLRQQLEARPTDDLTRRMLIDHLRRDRRFPRAIALAQEAADRLGEVAAASQWRVLTAEIHLRSGDAGAAAEALAVAYRLDPSPALLGRFATTVMNRSNVQARDYQRVVDELRRQPEFLNVDPSLRLVLARALFKQRRASEAMAQVRESFELRLERARGADADPFADAAWVTQLAEAMEEESPARVEEVVRELAGEQPMLWTQIGLGRMWANSGADGASRGLDMLRGIYEAIPSDQQRLRTLLLFEVGNIALQASRFPEAAETYRRLLELQPNQPLALNNLAFVLSEKLNRPQEAEPLATRAVSLMPTSWSVLDTAGRVQFLLGRTDEALRLLQRSVLIEEHPTNLSHLAEVLLAKGDIEEARSHLERAAGVLAVINDPSEEDRRRIERLRGEIAAKSGGA